MNEFMYLVEIYQNIFGNKYSTYFDALNYISITVFLFCSIFKNTRSISFLGSGTLSSFILFNLLLEYKLTQNSGAYLVIYSIIMLLVYLLEEKSNTTTVHS